MMDRNTNILVDGCQEENAGLIPPIKHDRSTDRLPQKSPAKLSLVKFPKNFVSSPGSLGLESEAEIKWLTEFIADVFSERSQKREKLLERHRIGRLLATETFINSQLNDNLPQRGVRNQRCVSDLFDITVNCNTKSENGPSKYILPSSNESTDFNPARSTEYSPQVYRFNCSDNDFGCEVSRRRIHTSFDELKICQRDDSTRHQVQWKTKSHYSLKEARNAQKWRVLSIRRACSGENDSIENEQSYDSETRSLPTYFDKTGLVETHVEMSRYKSARLGNKGFNFERGMSTRININGCFPPIFRKLSTSTPITSRGLVMSTFLKRKGRNIDKEFYHLLTPLKRRRIQIYWTGEAEF